jgi:excisionase family DNA binding protein
VLVALRVAAAHWREQVATSPSGRTDDPTEEAPSPSPSMSTSEVAARAGCTQRAVRLAIRDGRLPGELVGGRWLVRPEDAEHYRAARAA